MRGRKKQSEEDRPKISLEEELIEFISSLKDKPILTRLEHVNHRQAAVIMNGHKYVFPSYPHDEVESSGVAYPTELMPQPVKNASVVRTVSKEIEKGTTNVLIELVFEFENNKKATVVFVGKP